MPGTHQLPSLESIRAQFPALSGETVFFENAGGSQVPRVAIEAITRFLEHDNVQTGATYPEAIRSTQLVDNARDFANELFNGAGLGRVTFGMSSTGLLRMLADAYLDTLKPDDEVIIANTGHEANIGPWLRLEKFGATVRWWEVSSETFECPLDDLRDLLNERTRFVVFPHVSNLLGDIVDVAEITRLAHAVGAKVIVDGVAYAPHRAIDVEAWGCDWYVFSDYKVYGPHMAALWGRSEAYDELIGPNHFFIPKNYPSKFELGCLPYELLAGFLATKDYFEFLGGTRDAFKAMEGLERPLQEVLIDYLRMNRSVKIIGPNHGESGRVSTISFVSEKVSAETIVDRAVKAGFGIRNGHMYAYRLCEALGIPPEQGVVRVSPVHYNTLEEMDRFIRVLDGVL